MLHSFTVLARRLQPLRTLLLTLAALAAAAFVATLFLSTGAQDEGWMLLAVCVLLWTLCLLLIARAFIDPPPAIEPGDRLLVRAGKRLKLGLRWLLAVVMTGLCLAVLVATLKAARIVGGALGG